MNNSKYVIVLFLLCFISTIQLIGESLFGTKSIAYSTDAQWTIIGAGPAGIIVLGVLLDLGTDPKNIAWVDPEFNIGRMGKYYTSVPGNAKTKQFIEFLNCCKAFQEVQSPAMDYLYTLDQEIEYPLKIIVDPLLAITNHFCSIVQCDKSHLCGLNFANDVWQVSTTDRCFTSAHVILATGCHPKKSGYNCGNEIPLDLALDKEYLETQTTLEDTIAVIGSGQSAILLLKHLSELDVGRVLNFFIHPLDFDHPETGLKGITARWAKNVLLKTPPANLMRIHNSCATLKAWLPICNKIIYAVGFERNEIPPITQAPYLNFDDRTGILGPRLFGIGIAFPEKYEDEKGKTVSRIGLISFMEYAQEILPTWMATKVSLTRYAQFDDLFMIDIL